MSGNVIEFPIGISERRKAEASTPLHTDLGAAVDIAVWIRDLIIDGLNSGELLDDEDGPCVALAKFLQDKHGRDLAAAAEGCFGLIYGCDPYTFVRHVANSMTVKAPLGRPAR
jgi:hypothetical protein